MIKAIFIAVADYVPILAIKVASILLCIHTLKHIVELDYFIDLPYSYDEEVL